MSKRGDLSETAAEHVRDHNQAACRDYPSADKSGCEGRQSFAPGVGQSPLNMDFRLCEVSPDIFVWARQVEFVDLSGDSGRVTLRVADGRVDRSDRGDFKLVDDNDHQKDAGPDCLHFQTS